ncbi:hypothetical protein Leryth_019389 [Lithospermum erythrorhizon]|nr:hypothetical protein Leryth_019389 [Lithospermum erythrorhizon]
MVFVIENTPVSFHPSREWFFIGTLNDAWPHYYNSGRDPCRGSESIFSFAMLSPIQNAFSMIFPCL